MISIGHYQSEQEQLIAKPHTQQSTQQNKPSNWKLFIITLAITIMFVFFFINLQIIQTQNNLMTEIKINEVESQQFKREIMELISSNQKKIEQKLEVSAEVNEVLEQIIKEEDKQIEEQQKKQKNSLEKEQEINADRDDEEYYSDEDYQQSEEQKKKQLELFSTLDSDSFKLDDNFNIDDFRNIMGVIPQDA